MASGGGEVKGFAACRGEAERETGGCRPAGN